MRTELRAGEIYKYGSRLVRVVSPNHGRMTNVELVDGKTVVVDGCKLVVPTPDEKAQWPL